jgi:hypothetical protein
MAHIAEDLLLLLLDNAAGRPILDDARRQRLLSAAVLLDLAYDCRIRPSEPGDAVAPNRLVVLIGGGVTEPTRASALQLLARKPIDAANAIGKLSRSTEQQIFEQLERTGQLETTRLYTKGIRRKYAWTLIDRTRPARARAAILAAVADYQPPGPSAAAIISLLSSVGALGALLSFDQPGWQRVNGRAGEIASGSWVNESPTGLAEMNLAVTTAVVRAAL